jgi:gamma-glutamylputrescine oxidase
MGGQTHGGIDGVTAQTQPLARDLGSRRQIVLKEFALPNFVLDCFQLSADHRLLFGLGDSYSGTTPRNLGTSVRKQMLKVFPQLEDLSIPYAWGGFVDITMNEAPDFGRLGNNIYYLHGFSGHGLVVAGMAGKLVAEAIAGQAERFDLFCRIRHLPFPDGALMRTPALVLGMLYCRLRDAL